MRFDAGDFAAAIPAVAPFVSPDEYRPVLTRVEVTRIRGVCRLAATDSYQLGVARLDAEIDGLSASFARTVPAPLLKSLGAVAKARPGGEAELRWGEIGGPKEGRAGATRLWIARDGEERTELNGAVKFPNWRSFYQKDSHPPFGATLLDPRAVAQEIRSYVAEYPEESHFPVLLHLAEDGRVCAELHTNSPQVSYERVEVGEAEVKIPYTAAFNAKKLTSALRSAPPAIKRARLSYQEEESAQAKKPLYLESAFWRHMVMPIRV